MMSVPLRANDGGSTVVSVNEDIWQVEKSASGVCWCALAALYHEDQHVGAAEPQVRMEFQPKNGVSRYLTPSDGSDVSLIGRQNRQRRRALLSRTIKSAARLPQAVLWSATQPPVYLLAVAALP